MIFLAFYVLIFFFFTLNFESLVEIWWVDYKKLI